MRDALESKAFLAENKNKNAALVAVQMAPESLKPMSERLGMQLKPGIPEGQPFGEGLALRPMTMADLLEQFVKGHVVRDRGPDAVLTEPEAKALAQAQGQLLRGTYDGLLEAMSLNEQPDEDDARKAARAGVKALFDQVVAVVETPFLRYADFRAALAGPLEKARMASGPRPDGSGAFMPPHAFLLHGLKRMPNQGGLLGVEIVGHAMHESMLKPKAP